MDIACHKCQSKFRLPDEKVPAGKALSLKCPKCQEKIILEADPPPEREDIAITSGHGFEEVQAESWDAAEKPFDFVEEEGKTALVCESDAVVREKIINALGMMDYHITVVESGREALKKMRYHVYDMILVNETFESSDPDSNGVLIYLERLGIVTRRNIFVVMLTNRFRTLDNMMAFQRSVNMVLNISNIDEIDKILQRGLADNDYFYRTFNEGLKKAGRI